MTAFDRSAYLKRIGELSVELASSARKVGTNIGNNGSVDEFIALTRASDAAHKALLSALYALPRDLDGAEVKEHAA